MRKHNGLYGHFVRIENVVGPGHPDVCYCLKGIEGHIELKFREDAPARTTTPVFKHEGLRDDQIAWISWRIRHRGRVWIVAQVGPAIYAVPGSHYATFNDMPLHQLAKAAHWSETGVITASDWAAFRGLLMGPAR